MILEAKATKQRLEQPCFLMIPNRAKIRQTPSPQIQQAVKSLFSLQNQSGYTVVKNAKTLYD